MNPSASPRHPWKALAVVLAMLAIVHGARATVGEHDHGFTPAHVIHIGSADTDCSGMDIDDGTDDDTVVDLFDDDNWT